MSLKRFIPDDIQPRRFVGPIFFAIAIFYLAFHALNGERGFYAYLKQSRNLESSQTELAALKAEREALENRVHLLGDESLDLDLLDEEARRKLGTAKDTEVMLLVDPNGHITQ